MKLYRIIRKRQQFRTPRERLQNTMPGEAGALAALRLGLLVG